MVTVQAQKTRHTSRASGQTDTPVDLNYMSTINLRVTIAFPSTFWQCPLWNGGRNASRTKRYLLRISAKWINRFSEHARFKAKTTPRWSLIRSICDEYEISFLFFCCRISVLPYTFLNRNVNHNKTDLIGKLPRATHNALKAGTIRGIQNQKIRSQIRS